MSCWALIPLKAPGQGKQRLAGALPLPLRQKLVERMAARVLATLRRCPAIDGIAVVSPLPVAGADRWLPDRAGALNPALQAAAADAAALGVSELLVLHADLPWLEPDDVDAMLDAGRRRGFALAADEAGRGTNALYTRLPARVGFAFGHDSLQCHTSLARAAGLSPAIVQRPGLARDIDEPHQLDAALARVLDLQPPLPAKNPRRLPWPPTLWMPLDPTT